MIMVTTRPKATVERMWELRLRFHRNTVAVQVWGCSECLSLAQVPEGASDTTCVRCEQSFKLLGFLDVKSVPCARESVLYGSVGSLVVGLGHFVATSRVRRSCDFAVGGFICTMLGYWFYCRYNLAQQRIRQRMIREGMRNKLLYEGSSLDPERKQTGNERSDS
ncbi:PREDICTED: cytochrome c oxidase protein 20 homolog [Chaetura pelagica]|uniref:cytochrome c oxidase protein 20 homolog n=1 Tax=Chaetura pelagica TaxID=8897 RepID=UPI000523B465|nr:PREDICTED: cytochrome c oxidase protein 20 homolog [Chaetura pelagica]